MPDIIRSPNHLGDLVMSIPALMAAPDADVVVPKFLAPILSLLPRTGAIIPFVRGRRGFFDAAREIRARGRSHGVLLTRSFSSAAMFKLGRVQHIRGIDTDGRRILLNDVCDVSVMRDRPRRAAYYELVTGAAPTDDAVPLIAVSREHRDAWWKLVADVERTMARGGAADARGGAADARDGVADARDGVADAREGVAGARDGAAHAGDDAAARNARSAQRVIGVFPGGNAASRRWDPSRFAEMVAVLSEDARVIVFGGPGEAVITKIVAGERALDMGGRTDLLMLAAGLAECDLLVTNDSGPLHVAAAVGTRTLSFWGAGNPNETAPPGAAHSLLRHAELPCVPCVRNECPRRGAGYVLPEAKLECLQLIAVPDAVSAARTVLAK